MANACGVGGGGIVIPFLMIFFSIPIKECVPIVNFFGFIAGLTRFILNYKMKHPKKRHRLVIDYELVSLTLPISLMGTLLGIKIGEIMSPFIVMIS